MKQFITSILVIGLLINSFSSSAQEVDLSNGDLSILKGEKTINIEFTYDKIAVGEYSKESEYVKKKVDEMNAKEAGSGDEWAVKWVSGRKERYEPKFIELFSKTADMTFDSTAKYTLIVKTTFIEPGYQVVVKKKAAQMEGSVVLAATANKTKKLAVISVERGGGYFRGGSFDFTGRIAEVYAVTGRKVGALVAKAVK